MKRSVLIILVFGAISWIGYSSYELWVDDHNKVQPAYVFCEKDHSILLINRYEETSPTDYLKLLQKNILSPVLFRLDSLKIPNLKIYASGNRPILIFQKAGHWKEKEISNVINKFQVKGMQVQHQGNYLLISKDVQPCKRKEPFLIFRKRDKKASANYWKKVEGKWSRTDVYNLKNGFFEYQSSIPQFNYGAAVKDIPLFANVIPASITSYQFKERFFAAKHDSVFKNGPMNDWVDKGFVEISYKGTPVLISDYRSQQTPSLILIEKTKNENAIIIKNDLYSFSGFQLTKDFPVKKDQRFYVVAIEDKAVFTTSEDIARKLQVNYQLGNTLALNPDRKKQFFGGLPSHVNLREISKQQKKSTTWKNNLLFEVNTQPPNGRFSSDHKMTWSSSTDLEDYKLIPIYDHLRKGISVLCYGARGKYELLSPNGHVIWKGDAGAPIIGKVHIVDVFSNNKHQFLFRTKKEVFLVDLNGAYVGAFPYSSPNNITTGISAFIWNGTKRFLVGNKKGEITMITNVGKPKKIIQVGKESIISTPYALNIDGNLRVWAVNSSFRAYLGYLGVDEKAQPIGKMEIHHAVKSNGQVYNYFEKEKEVLVQRVDKEGMGAKSIAKGRIFKVSSPYVVIAKKKSFKVFNYEHQLLYSRLLPFSEVGGFIYLPKEGISIVLDYLQNKIYAYTKKGELTGFPKEGRKMIKAEYDKHKKILYIYTKIGPSIICYKNKL